MSRQAVTLIESAIVLVIIIIWVALSFVAYIEAMEKARNSEATNILKGWMHELQRAAIENKLYKYNAETHSISVKDIGAFNPFSGAQECSGKYYFSYDFVNPCIVDNTLTAIRLIATRCLHNSKPPRGTKPGYVFINWYIAENRTKIGVTNSDPGPVDCP